MKNASLVQIVSILANVGVVLGLVFLGAEVYQSNQMNRTTAWNNLIRTGIDFNDGIAQNSELAEILAKSNNGDSLTDAEAIRLRAFTAASMQRVWLDYQQINTGIISTEELKTRIPRFQTLLERFPAVRTVWEQTRDAYSPEFQRFVDSCVISDCDTIPQ